MEAMMSETSSSNTSYHKARLEAEYSRSESRHGATRLASCTRRKARSRRLPFALLSHVVACEVCEHLAMKPFQVASWPWLCRPRRKRSSFQNHATRAVWCSNSRPTRQETVAAPRHGAAYACPVIGRYHCGRP